MANADDYISQSYKDLVNKANEYVNNYNPNETVDYNDKRLTDVKAEQAEKEAEINKTYDNMINDSNKFYQDQINASKEWADKQSQLQQQNTDFAIEKINQEKDKAEKDYTKEQKASYVDYQKQSNKYGVNAEQMAISGLSNSGYSESSMVSMYNTYQNRVATARESFNQAILNYNNSIKEAQLTNNSALAEISYNALQQQLQLSLEGFQYKNSLLDAKTNQINANNSRYDTKYQNVLAQINQEIENRRNLYNTNVGILQDYNSAKRQIDQLLLQKEELLEKKREAEAELAYKREQSRIAQAQWEKEYALSKAKRYSSTSGSSGLTVKDSGTSSQLSSVQSKLDNIYNTLTKDLNTIYKNTSQNTKNAISEKMKSSITTYIQSQYNAGNISRSEAQNLFNRYGY